MTKTAPRPPPNGRIPPKDPSHCLVWFLDPPPNGRISVRQSILISNVDPPTDGRISGRQAMPCPFPGRPLSKARPTNLRTAATSTLREDFDHRTDPASDETTTRRTDPASDHRPKENGPGGLLSTQTAVYDLPPASAAMSISIDLTPPAVGRQARSRLDRLQHLRDLAAV